MTQNILSVLAAGLSLLVSPAHSSSAPYCGTGTAMISDVSPPEKIKGKVTDKGGLPIPQAIVAETVNQYSNNIVPCDSAGYFEIEVESGSSLIVSAVGYLPLELKPAEYQEAEQLDITLEMNPDFTLEDVVVTAKRKTIVTTPTGLIYNMNDNPATNDDALEAFRFVPMMMVKEDLPTVVGKGVPAVYVNNRKLKLSGQSLTAYLRSLPAKSIETVEIIRNPGARYEGADCVLEIKLKKRENDGVKGFINAKAYKIHDIEEDLNVSLDYTKNKWNSFVSLFLGDRRGYYDNRYETHYIEEDYTVDRTALEKSKGKVGNMNFIGVYQFSDAHSLGVNASASLNDNDGSRAGMTVYNNTGQHISSLSDREGTVWGATANLNYQYHSKDGKRYFIADADYLYNNYRQHVTNEMNNVDGQGHFQSLYLKEQQDVPQQSDIYSAKIEYGGKKDDGFSYDFGADAYYSYIRTDNRYWNWDKDEFVPDPQHSSDFRIKEFTPALFLDLTKWWNDKFYTSLSARLEYTKYDGKEYRQNRQFENDFLRVLPKLNSYYRISQNQGISYMLSYGLSRPSFYDMNPFVQRISPTEYSVGNPYLQPVKILFTELNFTLNNHLSSYLQYQLKDDIQTTTQKDVGDGVVENKPENIGRRNYVGFGLTGYFPYMKGRGAVNMNANYAWFKMDGDTEVGKLDYACHLGSATASNSFLLFPKQNIRFNLTGEYRTKERNGYMETPSSIGGYAELNTSFKGFSFAVYSQLMGYLYDGKISGTMKTVMSNDFLSDNQYLKGRNFQVGLRCSYRFGNDKVKQIRQRNTSNSGVKDRVGGKLN